MPGRAETKITVSQLDALLAEQHSQGKPDDATADKLKQVELTESLSPVAMNAFIKYQPGPLTIVQIRALALLSALLPPPPADLPTAPAPDTPTQTAIVARAVDYTVKQFSQLPAFTADKVTDHYQSGADAINVGAGVGGKMGHTELGDAPTTPYIHYLGHNSSVIVSERGIELPPAKVKGKDPVSHNGQISQSGSGPILGIILIDAGHGTMSWKRWETINGKQIAVFAFAVNRKQSHYQVNYCCFPQTEDVGNHGAPIYAGGNSGPTTANYGTNTSFVPFKASVGYHGELFIDPETGTIVRLIAQAEMKPTDLVRQEDMRIDYTPVQVAGKKYIVPTQTMILTEVVPSGNSFAKFNTRRTLFDIQYQNYQPASAAPATKQ